MNISVENIDKVNAVVTAVVEPADYTEKYEKAIKDAKKKMNMPGFRPGMVEAVWREHPRRRGEQDPSGRSFRLYPREQD